MAGDPSMVKGTVRDQTGKPVAGARVFFTGGPTPLPDIAALTDAEGRFVLSPPTPGTYQLECHAEGFAPGKLSLTIPTTGETQIVIDAS
jgi:protocatechuate 3,4-dioxygenase beta subunit